MTETAHTPLPYLRDGSLIYALDETGTCNRISIRVEGGISVNWRRSSPERTTDEEVEATAAFVHQAVNSHHRLIEALEDARTALSITRTNVMTEIGRCSDESRSPWAGVPEQLAKRIAKIDAALKESGRG